MFKITILPKKTGLKAIGVFRPSIFDEGFAKQIDENQNGEFYSKHKIHYWFSNDYALQEPDRDYDGGRDDGWDYERETWDAMTDGMYGDMPDGFDGDYSFLGR